MCENTFFSTLGRELFDIEQRFVPAPLRDFPADCASRIEGVDFDDTGITLAYELVYEDVPFADVVAVVRSFAQAGWGDGIVSRIDEGAGLRSDLALGADDLANLPAAPLFLSGIFTDANSGLHTITFEYVDGDVYPGALGSGNPTLVIGVLLGGPLESTGLGDPSILSTLKTIPDAALTPPQVAVVCGSAVMLMLVVGYPGSLLGSVVGARYDRVVAWMRKRLRAGSDASAERHSVPRWLVWPGFLLAAIIAGFVDPAFGPNLMSLRVLASALLGFIVFNLGVWTLTRVVVTRLEPTSKPYIKFRWGSLVVVLVAVLIARLLEFQPGVIFGLVAGLAFATTLALSRDALVILLGSGFGVVAAAVGWIGYTLLSPVAGSNPLLLFFSEFLSSMTIEGVSSLPLALLPLAALDGATLLQWKKWVWALAYALGLALFMIVLLTVPGSFAEMPGDFLRWLALFLTFAVVAVAVWAIDNFLSARRRKSA